VGDGDEVECGPKKKTAWLEIEVGL